MSRKYVTKDTAINGRGFELIDTIPSSDLASSDSGAGAALLRATAEEFKYKKLESAETTAAGYNKAETDFDETPDQHILILDQRIYEGSRSQLSPYYKYTAYRSGWYIAHCDVAIRVTNQETASIATYFDEPLELSLYRNGSKFPDTNATMSPYRVYNPTNADYYYFYQIPIHGTWAVYLKQGDYIDFRLNLYDKSSIVPLEFTISARCVIFNYGTKKENLTDENYR